MNLSSIAVAQEAIAFQTGDVFKQLSEEFTSLRKQAKSKTVTGKVLYEYENKNKNIDFTNLINILNKPGFNFTRIVSGDWATYIPLIKANHVLFQNRLQYLKDKHGLDSYKDARAVLVSAGIDVDEGTVNLKNATVSGFFSKLELTLVVNIGDIAGEMFTPEELAAIVLHEQGHVFTTFENLNKTFMTNQALMTCVNAFKAPISAQEKTTVFATTADKLKLDKLGKARLMQAKDEKEVYFVLMNERFNGTDYDHNTGDTNSAYHSVSSEYVADEYSTRMGAGEALASALKKLYVKNDKGAGAGLGKLLVGSVAMCMIASIGFLSISVTAFLGGTIGGFLAIQYLIGSAYAFGNSNKLYDNDRTRLVRIRNQMVAFLKENDVELEDSLAMVEKVEKLDEVIRASPEYNVFFSFYGAIATLVSGQYRKERAYELYQNKLEALAHNDLILKSRKLQNIQLAQRK